MKLSQNFKSYVDYLYNLPFPFRFSFPSLNLRAYSMIFSVGKKEEYSFIFKYGPCVLEVVMT